LLARDSGVVATSANNQLAASGKGRGPDHLYALRSNALRALSNPSVKPSDFLYSPAVFPASGAFSLIESQVVELTGTNARRLARGEIHTFNEIEGKSAGRNYAPLRAGGGE
jgi:hypothetical protein